MPIPPLFNDKADVIACVLHYYRTHSGELSGPTAAITHLWPALRRRLTPKLREQFLLTGLAHEVQRYVTSGSTPHQGWTASSAYLTVTPLTPDDPTGQGHPVHIPVERQAYEGPTVVYPQILLDTTYVTASGAKALLWCTVEDLQYVARGLEEQQFGLARRQAALRHGARLLTRHQAATIADLPPEVLQGFEARWRIAVHGEKKTAA